MTQQIINVTPHAIRIRVNADNKTAQPDPTDIVLQPSGTIARVSVQSVQSGDVNGLPIMSSVFGDPVDLPDPQDDTIFVGSMPLAQKAAAMGRTDVVSPNTAPKQDIRDDAGRTFAVFGFQRF